MNKEEIYKILEYAANFKLKKKDCGGYYGFGSINRCPQCQIEKMTMSEYEYVHYPKMAKLLESLPWERVVKYPRNPQIHEYPTEDGIYITMMDCNEHEVCTNTFRDGNFSWMNHTHIKWWMKLPE